MRRATRLDWSGCTMRRAMSASRRSRLLTSLLATSSTWMSGSCWRMRSSSGGSSRQATGWLALMRTVPLAPACAPETPRASACAPASMACADSASRSAVAVGCKPRPVRSNSTVPSCASSSAMWRPMVGWLDCSARAAPSRLPCSSTARKERTRFQSNAVFMNEILLWIFMQLCNFAMVPTIKPITEHMEMDMAKTVWVLGANGRLGRGGPGAALQAALDEGADAVVHAMNPARYTASAWRAEAPALLHQAITTALALRAVLLFPGNVYNFGEGMPAVLDAHTPQRPSTPLGQVRVALEQQLA